jgi:hypothetical protein
VAGDRQLIEIGEVVGADVRDEDRVDLGDGDVVLKTAEGPPTQVEDRIEAIALEQVAASGTPGAGP